MGAHCEPMAVRRSGVRARRVLAAAVLTVLGVGACSDDVPSGGPGPVGPVGPIGSVGPVDGADAGVVGSGDVVLETRAVEQFDRVVLRGEGSVTVLFGADELLTVETDDNLLELIETTVRDGVLEISTVAGTDIAPTDSVDYRVTARSLVEIELAGAGSIDVDRWPVETARVTLVGAGDIRIGSIEAEQLVVQHEGVGSITIAGTTTEQQVSITGVGDYDAADLASSTVSVVAAGAGEATVWVTGTLDARASGNGSVGYYGFPDLSRQLDGLGEITSLGER